MQLGYPTLFAFLTEHIGYSASAAQRRIEASRIFTAVPEVKEEIKLGSLNLSQVALVAQSIRQKQKESPKIEIKAYDKKVLLMSIKNQTYETSQKILSQSLDLEIKAFDKKVVQKDESVRMEITFTKAQMESFNKVKGLMSHVNPSPTVAEVFEYMAKYYLKRKDLVGNSNAIKSADCVGNSNALNSSGIAIPNRYPASKRRKLIPVQVKRIVWARAQGQCQHFNLSNRKICGSSHLLEIDHVKRLRHGGDNHPDNLQLLCKAHNLWRG